MRGKRASDGAPKLSESELAEALVAYLEQQGWDCYHEVEGAYGGRADLVAVGDREVWVFETKLTMSLALLEQAWRWIRFAMAHRVVVVTPHLQPGTPGHQLVHWICAKDGIGWFCIERGSVMPVHERVKPELHRHLCDQHLGTMVRPEHKTHARAGSTGGGFWTDFRGTCEEIVRVVRERPGISIGECIGAIRHHYSTTATARGSILKAAKKKVIPGVRLETDARGRFVLFPKDAP